MYEEWIADSVWNIYNGIIFVGFHNLGNVASDANGQSKHIENYAAFW